MDPDLESLTKSIFSRGRSLDLFDEEAIGETSYVYSGLRSFIERLSSEGGLPALESEKEELARNAVRGFERSLTERNQYYGFTDEQRLRIGAAYEALIGEVIEVSKRGGPGARLSETIVEHRRRLRSAFESPVREKPCFYYGAELQLELLGLSLGKIEEPLIDLGCGPEAKLVEYLRERGVDAHGIDRHAAEGRGYLRRGDWESFRLESGAWGTVVSHMAFSNHFIYHYLADDGEGYACAMKYREILESLKPLGSFHYAPALPFVEKYLDPGEYEIAYRELGNGLGASSVTRL
jgi:hypothetical protein